MGFIRKRNRAVLLQRRALQQTLPTGILVFIVNQKQDISDTLGLISGCFFVLILFLDICGVALSYFNSIREQNSNFRQEQMKCFLLFLHFLLLFCEDYVIIVLNSCYIVLNYD